MTLQNQKDQMLAKEGESRTAIEQLSDMNKLITGMEENKAKFAKACNNDSLKEIKLAINQGRSANGEAILDIITQFLTGNVKASWKHDGQKYFEDEVTFQMAIKKCDAAQNEKEWIREQANKVNMDSEGKKGALLAKISDAGEARDTIPFFPYFKVLFKLC